MEKTLFLHISSELIYIFSICLLKIMHNRVCQFIFFSKLGKQVVLKDTFLNIEIGNVIKNMVPHYFGTSIYD